ncbi:uncharacterized protein MELLADRAFT_94138 [Melampsora larici-populina 98AG31]|uniref:Uncharacterized protein n=1 Tax=Melampsora larici-populina (strain 98AG31 / pathotype 3-4-7) TaxID=747676 RepID=F4S6L7_MELLP|nr:uncharacterized protein MELLADRAFT_94138 [Melampsora larici-populina 98AG31]EGF99711.1 hypothetical protein MELLADRAFT_94138 [Melampsora larici-populina 98AG31]
MDKKTKSNLNNTFSNWFNFKKNFKRNPTNDPHYVIPFMKAHRSGSTVGGFWLNATATWIDVKKNPT